MRVQHNIPAMNAYRNYNNNSSGINKNLEKLSSGYKINRAGDDAAGLAISEKMRAQITGLEVAQNNAKNGISLVQTAEGALTEVQDMLNRMYNLAEQSANGTYDETLDRQQLDKEVQKLRTEIDRIASTANFNGQKLLDGSLKASDNGTTQETGETQETGSPQTPAATTYSISDATQDGDAGNSVNVSISGFNTDLGGKMISFTVSDDFSIVLSTSSLDGGVSVSDVTDLDSDGNADGLTYAGSQGSYKLTDSDGTEGTITINWADTQAPTSGTTTVTVTLRSSTSSGGTDSSQNNGAQGDTSVNGSGATFTAGKGKTAMGDDQDINTVKVGKGLVLWIGAEAEANNALEVNIDSIKSDDLVIGTANVDISTQEKALNSLQYIEAAINKVSDIRGTLGATQNRLEHTINNLSVMRENMQDAESTIRDTDVAEEMMKYTKNSILVQSAQAMLAQANQLPQGVLQLLQ